MASRPHTGAGLGELSGLAPGRPSAGRRLTALSGDERLLRRLATGPGAAEIHSVFRRVVNIRMAGGDDLWSLAAAGVDDAPDTLVVRCASFDALGLRPRARVWCATGGVAIEPGVEVTLEHARPWSPQLPAVDVGDAAVRHLERVVRPRGARGGAMAGAGAPDPVARETLRLLNANANALAAALAGDDLGAAYASGSRLVGLGPGLTPSGDDHLVGMAAGCAMRGDELKRPRDVLRRIVHDHAGRTNAISRAAMLHAVDGRFRRCILRLARSLGAGDPAAITASAERVMALGATSGTDILVGVLAGLSLEPPGGRVRPPRTPAPRRRAAPPRSTRAGRA